MQSKIVLISDDSDFFDYIIPKLPLRNSDEVIRFSFSMVPEKLHLIKSSLLIINSENNQEKTLQLIELAKDVPSIVFSYNNEEKFKINAYKKGMFAYFTLTTPDEELEANLLPALKFVSTMQKNNMYREMLVKHNLLLKNNEVFLDYNSILDKAIENIKKESISATLVAIAPSENKKFLIQQNQIETAILNHIRKNDILMNYAPNKYFLLLYNSNLNQSYKIWEKLTKILPNGMYAGFSLISSKSREQAVNEALNKLHIAISNNNDAFFSTKEEYIGTNFKFFRQEFNKKIDQVIAPVFYHIQQTYNDKLFGMRIEQGIGEGYGVFYIKSNSSTGTFRITSPGLSTVNVDISYEEKNGENTDSKRITFEPEELESGLLQDLLERFILEFKSLNEMNGANL